MLQPEIPIPNLYSDWMHTNELMDEEAREAGAGDLVFQEREHAFRPPLDPRNPPFLWRSILSMNTRIHEIRGPQAKRTDVFANSRIPAVDRSEIAGIVSRIQYVSAFESIATSEDDFMRTASNEIYRMMQVRWLRPPRTPWLL